MLHRIGEVTDSEGAAVSLKEAQFPAPFRSGLEYGAPARGTWNIVHVGMLIPEVHEIFVCASNCLRGVVLTAAEMGASERFSTVTIKENNVLDGDMEELVVDGVTDILNRLPKMPPAVLVYLSCIHHFMGCDIELCFERLRQRFPGTAFTDCYMNPIMRKSGLTPDQIMRRQLYSLLEPKSLQDNSINIIGNNVPTDETSDLIKLIRKSGKVLRDITLCSSYEEYQKMAESAVNISYNATACAGGEMLSHKLAQEHLYLPLTYTGEKIESNMRLLAEKLQTDYDPAEEKQRAVAALKKTHELIGDTAIAIDYTATTAPLSLAKLLTEHGFRVTRIYADSFSGEEREEFEWLREHAGDIKVYATVQVKMRALPRKTDEKVLAIGQKAAYFTGTANFVNIVEGGGMYGYDGIARLCGLMEEAFCNDRDASEHIQQKGWGCTCCL